MSRAGRHTIEAEGKTVALDADGHLACPGDWSPAVAKALARQNGIELGEEHWWLIGFVREYHERYGMPPLMRVVVAELRKRPGRADASSRSLYRLFPEEPIREACRYGGLPRPESCI